MGRFLAPILVVCLLIAGLCLAPAQSTSVGTNPRVADDDVLAPPVLLAPAFGATDIPTSPLFRWSGGTGATSYSIQVSTSPVFADFIVNESGLTDTVFTPPVLFADGTIYYWRVRSEGPGGIGRWEPQLAGWPFATETEGVHAPALISPAPNATTVSVLPTFVWSSVEGATAYELQISASLGFADIVVDVNDLTSTSYTLIDPLPEEVIFFWRVRSFAGPASSVWSPIIAGRLFKTGTALPPGPVLLTPGKDAINIPTQPTFTWTNVPGVLGYQLQVSASPLFDVTLFDKEDISETSFTLPANLANATTYYWHVRSISPVGPGLWSPLLIGRPFTTAHGSLPAPAPLLPAAGAVDVPVRPTFQWNAVDGATSYDIEITSSQFLGGTEYSKTGIPGTTFEPPPGALNYGILYSWHVRAVNAEGNSAWSEGADGRTFTTLIKPPIAPLLYVPPDGSTDMAQAIILGWWNNTEFTSTSFHVQVATDPEFQTIVVDQDHVVATETVVNLALHTKYYWRVMGINQTGSSDWSSVWTFSTGDASLALPTLVSPLAEAMDVPLTPTFTWNPTPGATAYDLQVSVSPMFIDASPAVDQHGLTGTTFKSAAPLHKTTKYYWRVRAMNEQDTTLWSPPLMPRSFTTVPPIPPPPRLLGPSYADVNVSLAPTLCWVPAPGAVSYIIIIATDPDFDNVVASYCGIVDPCFTLPEELSGSTTFFWHVASTNAGGSSEFSPTWKFNTVNTNPTPPTIVTQPTITALVIGQSATLRVGAKGTGPLMYQWMEGSEAIPGAVEPIFTTPAFQEDDAGASFRCVVSNELGSMTSDPAIVVFSSENPQLLTNGDFEAGMEPWGFFSNGVASITDDPQGSDGGRSAHVVIAGEGANVQLYQSGIPLEPNTLYRLTLRARANRPTAVSATLLKHACPYSSYGLSEDLYLERNWKTFSVEFSTPYFTNPVNDARLMLWLAAFDAQGDEYFFDDIVLKKAKIGSGSVSILANPGFESGTLPWKFFSDGEGTFDTDVPGDGSLHAGHITIEKEGTNVQLYQDGITLSPYALYRLSFKAASNTGHQLSVWLHQHAPPYDDYGLANKVFDLKNTWISYSFLFTTSNFSGTVHDGRLRFWLAPYAAKGDEYLLDDVILEKLEASMLIGRQAEDAGASSKESSPTEFSLSDNYPNPFNPSTTISYTLPEPAQVSLVVFNVLGQEVATLASGLQPAGRYSVVWDSHRNTIGELSSGVYFCRFMAFPASGGQHSNLRKMLLLK